MRAFKCIKNEIFQTRLLCALRNKNNQQLRSSMLELHSLLPSRHFSRHFFPPPATACLLKTCSHGIRSHKGGALLAVFRRSQLGVKTRVASRLKPP